MKLASCFCSFVWLISVVSFFIAFVYLICGGVTYVVRLNISLSFSSFLPSVGVQHMQNTEPGRQTVWECATAVVCGTLLSRTYLFEDVSQLK